MVRGAEGCRRACRSAVGAEGYLECCKAAKASPWASLVLHSPVRLKGDLCAVGCSGGKSHESMASSGDHARLGGGSASCSARRVWSIRDAVRGGRDSGRLGWWGRARRAEGPPARLSAVGRRLGFDVVHAPNTCVPRNRNANTTRPREDLCRVRRRSARRSRIHAESLSGPSISGLYK